MRSCHTPSPNVNNNDFRSWTQGGARLLGIDTELLSSMPIFELWGSPSFTPRECPIAQSVSKKHGGSVPAKALRNLSQY
ncbi:hypothetical protein AHAS_Ahas20G0127800 [Arachis hypogaea]